MLQIMPPLIIVFRYVFLDDSSVSNGVLTVLWSFSSAECMGEWSILGRAVDFALLAKELVES